MPCRRLRQGSGLILGPPVKAKHLILKSSGLPCADRGNLKLNQNTTKTDGAMLPKPNPSSAPPLTPSGRTPSVTGIALQRRDRGPDPRKFAIAGGKIQSAAPVEDAALIESSFRASGEVPSQSHPQLVLESAEANLRAGISFLNSQNDCIQRISDKLADAARLWKLSRIPGIESSRLETLQEEFEDARKGVEGLKSACSGAVPLFSDGQSSPIRLYHPSRRKWQLLLIERSDLGTASLLTFSMGKIYGDAPAFHLDLETIERAHDSLSQPKAANHMQVNLLSSCLDGVIERLGDPHPEIPNHLPSGDQRPTSANLLRSFN